MAGDYVIVQVTLPKKREMLRMRELTGMSRQEALGYYLEFLIWADSETTDGTFPGMTLSSLSAIWDDDRTATEPRHDGSLGFRFCRAMVVVGWLVENADGLVFPKFERWMSKCAKRRLQKNLSKRRGRMLRGQDGDNAATRDDATGSPESGLEREKEIEIESKKTPLPPLGGKIQPATSEKPAKKQRGKPTEWDGTLPAALDVPAFRDAWGRWEADRRARKKPLTAEARRLSWRSCEAWGVEKAIAAIEQSITHGWQGLFEPDGKGRKGEGKREQYARELDSLFGTEGKP